MSSVHKHANPVNQSKLKALQIYVTGAKRKKTETVTSLLEKKIHNARKRVLFKRTQIAVKIKTFTILMCNETAIIPKIVPSF